MKRRGEGMRGEKRGGKGRYGEGGEGRRRKREKGLILRGIHLTCALRGFAGLP